MTGLASAGAVTAAVPAAEDVADDNARSMGVFGACVGFCWHEVACTEWDRGAVREKGIEV